MLKSLNQKVRGWLFSLPYGNTRTQSRRGIVGT